MCGKAATVLAKENSLGREGGQKELITHEDFLICLCGKLFIRKRELQYNRGCVCMQD